MSSVLTSEGAAVPARAGVAKAAVVMFLAEALLLPTGIVTAAFLTRMLGPELYGLFSLASAVAVWASWMATAPFPVKAVVSVVARQDDWKASASLILRLHLVSGIVVALAIVLLAFPLAGWIGDQRLATYLLLFSAEVLLFAVARAHRNVLGGLGDYRVRALATALRWLARMVLILVLVGFGLSVTGAVIASTAAVALELLVYRWRLPLAPLKRTSLRTHDVVAGTWTLILHASVTRLLSRLDIVLLAILGGTVIESGWYGAAQNLAILPAMLAMSLSPILLGSLVRMAKLGADQDARELAWDTLRVGFALVAFCGIVAGCADEIVGLLYGPAFAPAAPLLAILFLAAIANLVLSISIDLLVARNGNHAAGVVSLVMLATGLVAYTILIPALGPIGAAAATALTCCAGAMLGAMWCGRRWGFGLPWATLVRAVLIGFALWLLGSILPSRGAASVLELVVLTALVPLAFLALGEVTRAELAARAPGWRSFFGR